MKQKVIFVSQAMNKIHNIVKKIASFPTTVLIEGETGVGKEVIADFIHQSSPRSHMPFIKVNCGAIPESLLESELFGYERGAFTGAKREGSLGLFESAHKGSLLLDEVGQMSQSIQVKLLRVLQDHEIRHIGGSWSKSIDVRILACTNTDLLEQVKKGDFRLDLYYRLNVVNIKIPPLRDRRDDIIPLIEYFLDHFYSEYGYKKKFDEKSLSLILNCRFGGNIRELRNIVESSYVNSDNECINVDSLPEYIRNCTTPFPKEAFSNMDMKGVPLPQLLDTIERQEIIKAVSSSDSLRKAATLLGISNATMLRRIKYHNLKFNRQK